MTTTRQETQTTVLTAGTVYAAHDRYLCTDCAGYTANATGRDLNGHRLTKVTPAEAAEWAALGMGTLTCECGSASVAAA